MNQRFVVKKVTIYFLFLVQLSLNVYAITFKEICNTFEQEYDGCSQNYIENDLQKKRFFSLCTYMLLFLLTDDKNTIETAGKENDSFDYLYNFFINHKNLLYSNKTSFLNNKEVYFNDQKFLTKDSFKYNGLDYNDLEKIKLSNFREFEITCDKAARYENAIHKGGETVLFFLGTYYINKIQRFLRAHYESEFLLKSYKELEHLTQKELEAFINDNIKKRIPTFYYYSPLFLKELTSFLMGLVNHIGLRVDVENKDNTYMKLTLNNFFGKNHSNYSFLIILLKYLFEFWNTKKMYSMQSHILANYLSDQENFNEFKSICKQCENSGEDKLLQEWLFKVYSSNDSKLKNIISFGRGHVIPWIFQGLGMPF